MVCKITRTMGNSLCVTTGMSTTVVAHNGRVNDLVHARFLNVLQLRDDCLPQLRTNCRTCTTTTTTLSMYSNWRISVVKKTMTICICATTGVSATSPRILRTWRCTITGMSTWSKNCTSCTSRHNNGHVHTLSKSWTIPSRRPAQQGHRPPRRRQARTQQETQPAPHRRNRHGNPATATPRPTAHSLPQSMPEELVTRLVHDELSRCLHPRASTSQDDPSRVYVHKMLN